MPSTITNTVNSPQGAHTSSLQQKRRTIVKLLSRPSQRQSTKDVTMGNDEDVAVGP